jgi:hypothetical protein
MSEAKRRSVVGCFTVEVWELIIKALAGVSPLDSLDRAVADWVIEDIRELIDREPLKRLDL